MRCQICGDRLQRWEIGYHLDCGAERGYPEAEIDWLEWADEYNERIEQLESEGKII